MRDHPIYVVKVQKLVTDWIEVRAGSKDEALKKAEEKPGVVAATEIKAGTLSQHFFRDIAWAVTR